MNSLIIITEEDAWQPTNWFKSMESSESDSGQLVVERSDSWISLLECDDVFCDYDDNEERTVRSLLEVSTSYLVEWKGDELLESLINAFPPGESSVIDNDHGLICNLVEVQNIPIGRWLSESELSS